MTAHNKPSSMLRENQLELISVKPTQVNFPPSADLGMWHGLSWSKPNHLRSKTSYIYYELCPEYPAAASEYVKLNYNVQL